jgi:cytochrome P450
VAGDDCKQRRHGADHAVHVHIQVVRPNLSNTDLSASAVQSGVFQHCAISDHAMLSQQPEAHANRRERLAPDLLCQRGRPPPRVC